MAYKTRIITLASFAAFSAVSFAETLDHKISVQGGLLYPLSSNTRNATKNTGFNLAIEYQLNTNLPGNGANQTSIQLGFSRVGTGDDRIDTMNISAINRAPFQPYGNSNLYYGYGVGVFFHDSRQNVFVGGGSSGGGSFVVMSGRNTRIGFQALIGSKFGNNAFAEVGVRIVGDADGRNANAATLNVGVRF